MKKYVTDKFSVYPHTRTLAPILVPIANNGVVGYFW